jgi:hypothetical protein
MRCSYSVASLADTWPQGVFRSQLLRSAMTHNKQLQRTVIRRRGDGASAPFHYALAPRFTRQRAAAELPR